MLARGVINGLQKLRTDHDEQDHYVSQRASHMYCRETVLQVAGEQAAGEVPGFVDSPAAECRCFAASRGEPWVQEPCWHWAREVREQGPWQSAKGTTHSSGQNTLIARSRAASLGDRPGVAEVAGVDAAVAVLVSRPVEPVVVRLAQP